MSEEKSIEELRQDVIDCDINDPEYTSLNNAITELGEYRKESKKSEGIIAHASTALINCVEQRDKLQAKLEKAKNELIKLADEHMGNSELDRACDYLQESMRDILKSLEEG